MDNREEPIRAFTVGQFLVVFVAYNDAVWSAQILLYALGIAVAVILRSTGGRYRGPHVASPSIKELLPGTSRFLHLCWPNLTGIVTDGDALIGDSAGLLGRQRPHIPGQEVRMSKVLAVYGTAYGQTEKVVRRIAEWLTAVGHTVTVVKGDALPRTLSLDEYDAFLVGASVIAGRHQRYIEDFVRGHATLLNFMPSAFVSVSGAAGDARPERQAEARQRVEEFRRATGWRPRLQATVGGAMAYTKYGFFLRWMTKLMSKRMGGPTDTSRDHEFTDWGAVDRFAREVGATVTRPVEVAGT